LDLTTHQ